MKSSKTISMDMETWIETEKRATFKGYSLSKYIEKLIRLGITKEQELEEEVINQAISVTGKNVKRILEAKPEHEEHEKSD